ncbi:hypothetical protein GGTG_11030 [Gaeumannomyces tritici R3-111a-1]|uniref:Uncharacterized protein n=1 Tax=Gaeumannomyces tritici (strain R3-111a-1) TaxID=644352 RepID=J3PC06_GAET3|nr:hypothetical protein GGTG_11030 [Gaeumannomyces tritici R3-111a-1]EJT71776.1 hypothetical protein GGTG_11030 [Gaeumannomyces tritici R3-111a-1]
MSRPAARPGITRNVSYASTITIVDESSPISTGSSNNEPWSFKEGSLPWDGKRIVEERGIPTPVPEEGNRLERRRWFRLGVWGFTTIALGSFVTLAILGFLGFLWTTEAVSGSERAPAAWRWVVLGGRATQAVTLATVVARAAITAQSTVYTSLIAGIALERYGVLLSAAAQFSVLRAINDGPLRLAWLLLTSSPRRSALLAGLAVVLFATTVAVQFSSTILVSDLEFSALSNGWLDRPTAYVPFGEISSPGAADAVPSGKTGLSDTGMVRRGFLPVRQQQIIRRYHSPAIVFNSRFLRDQNARAREGFSNSICVPDGRGAADSARNFTLSDEAVPRHAGMFLFLRTNGAAELWRGPNMTVVSGQFPLAAAAGDGGGGGGADEWASFEVAVGGRFVGAQLTTGGLRVDASLCFQEAAFDMSDVKVQYLTTRLVSSNYKAPRSGGGGNVSLLMDPLGADEVSLDFEPHVEYQALFRDLLNATGRPAVALQSVLAALAGSMVTEAMPQFNVRPNATVTSSEFVLTPHRTRGLVVVAAVAGANMACGLAALTTSHSARGSFWQVLSQLVSEHTVGPRVLRRAQRPRRRQPHR